MFGLHVFLFVFRKTHYPFVLLIKLFLINFTLILVKKLLLHMLMLLLRDHVDMSIPFESQLYQHFLLPSFLLLFFLFCNVLIQNFPVLPDRKFLVVIQTNYCISKNMYLSVLSVTLIVFSVRYETVLSKDALRHRLQIISCLDWR